VESVNPSFIVLPPEGNLDALAAARCLMLLFPGSTLVRPQHLAPNAWDMAQRSEWYRPVPLRELPVGRPLSLHLIGLFSARQFPELTEILNTSAHQITVYSWQKPDFGVPFQHQIPRASSLTAFLAGGIPGFPRAIRPTDALLMQMGIAEETGLLVNKRVTPLDREIWHALQALALPTRVISNQIVCGLREGQRGLLRDLFKNSQNIEIQGHSMVLSLVRSHGNVQEMEPVMDAFWSREEPHFLIGGIIEKHRTAVWARHRLPLPSLKTVFRALQPRVLHRWVVFSVKERNPETIRALIVQELWHGLSAEPCAEEIMISPPQCVDAGTSVAQTLETMRRFHLMGLLVTDKGNFAGVISRKDVDRAEHMNLLEAPIDSFMERNLPIVAPDTPVRVLRHIMAHHNLTRLPVVYQGKPLGIITSRELLRALPDPLPLPQRFLPLAPTSVLPSPAHLTALFKRIAPVPVFHILKKIGEKARECGRKAYLVGGVVRDLFLEKTSLDMDIVLIGDAISFVQQLMTDLKGEVRYFEEFHTARLHVEGMKIDFVTARIEHYAHAGALPQVEFSGLSNDLFRRDFSINALALDLLPDRFFRLIDFFGGYADLQQRSIRILHSMSFMEDPTRMFRALRFANRFHFALTEDTQRALQTALDREVLRTLSVNRIWNEVSRCFAEPRPMLLLQQLLESGIMSFLHPDLKAAGFPANRFKLIPSVGKRFRAAIAPIHLECVYWAGLLAPVPLEDARQLLIDSCYPTDLRRIIVMSLEALHKVPQALARLEPADRLGLYELFQGIPAEGLAALILFALDKQGVKMLFEYVGNLRAIHLNITGEDLHELGVPAGPLFGKILRRVLAEKLTGTLPTRKDELDYVLRAFQDLRLQGT
jgi:tRNA nucleotidyltransferase (CCA-adding enzyme)